MVCDWFSFRSALCVSVVQGSLLVIVIMIDGSKKKTVVKVALVSFMKSAVNDKLNHYF